MVLLLSKLVAQWSTAAWPRLVNRTTEELPLEELWSSGLGGGVRCAGVGGFLLFCSALRLRAPGALEDSPVGAPEVGVAQRVADRIDSAVDIA